MDSMIGKRIKKRRKELQITQTQIKEITGISTGNLSEIENGKILPSSSALIQLSKALECSTDYILFGKSSINDNTDLSYIRDLNEEQLISCYRDLPADDQDELLKIAKIKVDKIKTKKTAMSCISETSNLKSETA